MADDTIKDTNTPPAEVSTFPAEDADAEQNSESGVPAAMPPDGDVPEEPPQTAGEYEERPAQPSTAATSKQVTAAGIRTYRKFWGLTQIELADFMGVSRSAVSQWELGGMSVSRRALERIASALLVPAWYIHQNLPVPSKLVALRKAALGSLEEAHKFAEGPPEPRPHAPRTSERDPAWEIPNLKSDEAAILKLYRDLPGPFRETFWDMLKSLSKLTEFYETVPTFVRIDDDAPGDGAQEQAPGDDMQEKTPGDDAQELAPGDDAQEQTPGDGAQEQAPGDGAQEQAQDNEKE